MNKAVLTTLAAAACAVLAACGSSAAKNTSLAPGRTPSLATGTPAGSNTGAITIHGKLVILGKEAAKVVGSTLPAVPVQVSGLVTDHGHIGLNGKNNGTSVIPLAHGGLLVRHEGKNEKGPAPKGTCAYTSASAGKYKVLPGGTGAYKGAKGHGVFTVIFTEVAKRNAKGHCMTGKNAAPKSLTVTFKATGPLTLAK